MVTEWLKKNWRLALRSVQKAESDRSGVFTRCGTPLVYSGELKIVPCMLEGTPSQRWAGDDGPKVNGGTYKGAQRPRFERLHRFDRSAE